MKMQQLQQARGVFTGNLGQLPCPENTPLIRRAAAEGMVLLENDGTLPLQTGKLALFGAGADGTIYCGTGSGYVCTPHPVTVREGLEKAGFTLTSSGWLKRCADHERMVNKNKSSQKSEMIHYHYGLVRQREIVLFAVIQPTSPTLEKKDMGMP